MTDAFPQTSVLTIARGRDSHLRNLVLGLLRQTARPRELVIGVMQDRLYTDLPETPFPIRQIRVPGAELPLAEARNTVAREAGGSVLAFVDIDCIPAPGLLADYARFARAGAGLIMGEVLYLPAGAARPGWRYADFDRVAEKHSDRQGPPPQGLRRCEDYRCFWSLNFALHRRDWEASGGFDPAYRGYGGEDTDFGRTLDARGIAIWWAKGARVYHQYHPHCMPPVHHLSTVVRNAEIFAGKWGHLTMEHWLAAFERMGLIARGPEGLEIIAAPSEADFALCRQQEDMPFASSWRVMQALRARDGALGLAAE